MKRVKRILFLVASNVAAVILLGVVSEVVARRVEVRYFPSPPVVRPWDSLPDKQPGEFRIFTYGGSTAYGQYFQEIGFVAQLKYWLSQFVPDRKIAVFNFAQRREDTAFSVVALKATIDAKPDLLIVLNGHNEFLQMRSPDKVSPQNLLSHRLSQLATVRMFTRIRARLHWGRGANALPKKLTGVDRTSDAFKTRLDLFRIRNQAMIDLAIDRRVPLFLGTQASNILDWPPVYRSIAGGDASYESKVAGVRALIDGGRLEEAEASLQPEVAAHPNDAMWVYLSGRAAYQRQDYALASTLLTMAKDLDPFPWRALSALNDVIRSLAVGREDDGIFLLDTERELSQHARHGLAGFELVSDNCHLTALGESIIAAQVLRKIMGVGLLKSSVQLPDRLSLDVYLKRNGYLQPGSDTLYRYLLANAKYAMKTPFLNLDIARRYLSEAKRIRESDWEVWGNLATISFLEEQVEQGKLELQKAEALHGGPLDLNDLGRLPYLREAMKRANPSFARRGI